MFPYVFARHAAFSFVFVCFRLCRSWRSFAVQRISAAVQRAAAFELSQALNLSTALDPRAAADLSSEAAATAA